MKIGTVYVLSQGARLTKVGERLVIRDIKQNIIQDIPFFRIKEIICFGCVEISAHTIFQLMYRGIDVVYLTLSGRFKCRLSSYNEKSVISRLAQYKRASDYPFCLNTARAIVKGKLENYRKWLMLKNRRGVAACEAEIAQICEAIRLADVCADTNELLGIEGIGSKAYFEGFRKNLKQDLGFFERNRRPPKDPVNAMLSFGYTLLLQKVLSAIERAGLDPFISNLHAIQNARPSLALDLIEEFRHFVVDAAVIKLVNLVQVRPENFIKTADRGVLMSKACIALLIKELQARLSGHVVYSNDGKKTQVQDQIVKQAYHYRAVVCGEEKQYKPCMFMWK